MTEKLKACPFCGGEAALWTFFDLYESYYYISCATCGVRTKYIDTEDLCIEAWNRRAENAEMSND